MPEETIRSFLCFGSLFNNLSIFKAWLCVPIRFLKTNVACDF